MTREAKIGMLTGLGVIVLIGVLLSEYLGDPKDILAGNPSGAAPANNGPTGRSAELPVGAEYRRQRMDPVSVPGMGQTLAGGNEISPPFATNNGVVPPAYATDTPAPAPEHAVPGPVIGLPISPIAVGPSPTDDQVAAGPATFQLPDPTVPASVKSLTTQPANILYVILPSDTLTKIANKFYKSAKPADLQRIIAANPATLKDTNSTLVAGKKLTIPTLVPSPIAPPPPAARRSQTHDGPAALLQHHRSRAQTQQRENLHRAIGRHVGKNRQAHRPHQCHRDGGQAQNGQRHQGCPLAAGRPGP